MNPTLIFGDILQQKEDEIISSGENIFLKPLVEYVRLRLDNFEEPNMMNLATKTAAFYRESQNMALTLKSNSE